MFVYIHTFSESRYFILNVSVNYHICINAYVFVCVCVCVSMVENLHEYRIQNGSTFLANYSLFLLQTGISIYLIRLIGSWLVFFIINLILATVGWLVLVKF